MSDVSNVCDVRDASNARLVSDAINVSDVINAKLIFPGMATFSLAVWSDESQNWDSQLVCSLGLKVLA